ncbi:phosphoenolpyruvate--protein phosphotransferase [Agarivorans sp. TSD2052]|uniref:phosphoenolpyruvate--protein phosphotransferase n=1 Tax=Agarivorans sp. TSD2052 TaxID=2937286 RepID=UPI00200FA629|nr:phosphoenolpyruvate--protein phosphotransferase [Agarivorans sp. TSD2052]UPW18072.1 phosphoenolpyruvate--protein phosphotransferase [Agarivorans sp. TSD2052]
MISIVVVSHSLKLAVGILELAAQMTHGKIKLVCAAGVDDPENPIGTDSVAILEAIESVYSEDGVLVFVDIGSAILSTDMALELLDAEKVKNVHVTAAPIVEGTISASVAAAAGLSLNEVIDESHLALPSKQKQVAEKNREESVVLDFKTTEIIPNRNTVSVTTEVKNPHGIHARPASAIVSAVASFDAVITLKNGNNEVNAKSINSIALLGAKKGDRVVCSASGNEAAAAIKAFELLASNNFNEDIGQSKEPLINDDGNGYLNRGWGGESKNIDGCIKGVPASKGIAIAPISLFQTTMPKPSHRKSLGIEFERTTFLKAKEKAIEGLKLLAAKTVKEGATNQAEIFNAHIQMLDDPFLDNQISDLLNSDIDIETAWEIVVTRTAKAYADSSSDYMQERANDILDIGKRIMLLLLDIDEVKIEYSTPIILVADDLTPSDTAQLDPSFVKGLILAKGGHTSHSAILARSLGIPAIVGVNGTKSLVNGDIVIMDGITGSIMLNPAKEDIDGYRIQIEADESEKRQAIQLAKQAASTIDEQSIDIYANVATLKDVDDALSGGAEGIGLLRSEFLFMDRSEMPSEESQFEFYSEVASAFNGQPVIIRTLDIGGDKPLSYLQQTEEDNPFLGSRGIRLCLNNKMVFETQLKALLRATAKNSNIEIMFPMIATFEELKEAKSLLNDCHRDLVAKEVASKIPKVGIMIELPSAVVIADQLAKEADFFSIGTNDLTQYVMAADRGNEAVSYLVSGAQPAVLKMISMTAEAARKASIRVGICGELAGDDRFTETFVGLGIDELSMSPIRIAEVKQTIRKLSKKDATNKAQQILELNSLSEVIKVL